MKRDDIPGKIDQGQWPYFYLLAAKGNTVAVACAACYNRLKTANYKVANNPAARASVLVELLGHALRHADLFGEGRIVRRAGHQPRLLGRRGRHQSSAEALIVPVPATQVIARDRHAELRSADGADVAARTRADDD